MGFKQSLNGAFNLIIRYLTKIPDIIIIITIVDLLAFLRSEACSYVNGQIIAIDGGQSNVYGAV